MKKLFLILIVAFTLTAGAYAAFCKDTNGSKFCGESCTSAGGECSCTGECSEAEIKAVVA